MTFKATKLNHTINYLQGENDYSFYLSFFRVFISLLLLIKIISQWTLIPLLYSGSDYLIPTNKEIDFFFLSFNSSIIRSHIYIFLGVYVLLLIFYLFGTGKNLTAFFVFLFYEILQKLCPQILNGGDNFLRFILLYLTFADSFNFFTLRRNNITKNIKLKNFFSNLVVLSIRIHLCLIYFISAIHKIHSDVWFNGVATYYILNIERFQGTPLNHAIANNPVLVTASTYGTWILELVYPFIVWLKYLRKYAILAMILLHISISVLMMLYDFQLLFIVVQGFFFANQEWLKSNIFTRLYYEN